MQFELILEHILWTNYIVDASRVRPLVPQSLELDHGVDADCRHCPVSVVSFHVASLRVNRRKVPVAYHEINYRTYVKSADGPGVYFFAIRLGSRVTALAAKVIGAPIRFDPIKLNFTQNEGEPAVEIESHGFTAQARVTGEPVADCEFIVERPVGYLFSRRAALRISASHERLAAMKAEVRRIRCPLLLDLGLVRESEVSKPESAFYLAGAALIASVSRFRP